MNSSSLWKSPTPIAPACCADASSDSEPILAATWILRPSRVPGSTCRYARSPDCCSHCASIRRDISFSCSSERSSQTSPLLPSIDKRDTERSLSLSSGRPRTAGIPCAHAMIATWDVALPDRHTMPRMLRQSARARSGADNSSARMMLGAPISLSDFCCLPRSTAAIARVRPRISSARLRRYSSVKDSNANARSCPHWSVVVAPRDLRYRLEDFTAHCALLRAAAGLGQRRQCAFQRRSESRRFAIDLVLLHELPVDGEFLTEIHQRAAEREPLAGRNAPQRRRRQGRDGVGRPNPMSGHGLSIRRAMGRAMPVHRRRTLIGSALHHCAGIGQEPGQPIDGLAFVCAFRPKHDLVVVLDAQQYQFHGALGICPGIATPDFQRAIEFSGKFCKLHRRARVQTLAYLDDDLGFQHGGTFAISRGWRRMTRVSFRRRRFPWRPVRRASSVAGATASLWRYRCVAQRPGDQMSTPSRRAMRVVIHSVTMPLRRFTNRPTNK